MKEQKLKLNKMRKLMKKNLKKIFKEITYGTQPVKKMTGLDAFIKED